MKKGNRGGRFSPAPAACLALAACLAVLPAAGCSRQPGVLDRIREAGAITALVPENAGEYAYLSGDGVTWNGSEIQLARAVAARVGVRLDVRALPKAELLAEIAQGSADMAIGRIAYNESLPYNYAVSQPYDAGRLYAVTPKGVLLPTAGALKNRRIGVTDQLSENALIAVNQIEGITIDVYPDTQLVGQSLAGRQADAYLCYGDQAFALAGDPALQAQNIMLYEDSGESYVVVCPRSSGELLAPINEAIAQLRGEGGESGKNGESGTDGSSDGAAGGSSDGAAGGG